jgi:Na+-translocating ferredoxin:NAD+ oxidoreductase RnfD subunit
MKEVQWLAGSFAVIAGALFALGLSDVLFGGYTIKQQGITELLAGAVMALICFASLLIRPRKQK